MFLRIEVGFMADMVRKAQSQQKEKLGIFAYPIAMVRNLFKSKPKESKYVLTLDGKKKKATGVGLMIANVGNVGIPGISIQPSVSCSDKLLDVFVLQSSDVAALFSVGTSALAGTQKPPSLKHWTAKKIKVEIVPKQTVIIDDKPVTEMAFDIEVSPIRLTVLV